MTPSGEGLSRPFWDKRFLSLQNWRELFRRDKSARETITTPTPPPVDEQDLSVSPAVLAASFTPAYDQSSPIVSRAHQGEASLPAERTINSLTSVSSDHDKSPSQTLAPISSAIAASLNASPIARSSSPLVTNLISNIVGASFRLPSPPRLTRRRPAAGPVGT